MSARRAACRVVRGARSGRRRAGSSTRSKPPAARELLERRHRAPSTRSRRSVPLAARPNCARAWSRSCYDRFCDDALYSVAESPHRVPEGACGATRDDRETASRGLGRGRERASIAAVAGATVLAQDQDLAQAISRITRHGVPRQRWPAGRSFVTTLPAPTTASAPMLTPGHTITPVASHAPSPIVTGRAVSVPRRRSAESSGWSAVSRCTLGPIWTSCADRHLGAVEYDRAVVDERPCADADVVAVVALERRHHLGVFPQLAEQLGEDRSARSDVAEARWR